MSLEDEPGTRRFLRHALATLAYHAGKTVRGTPADFGAWRQSPESPSCVEILAHMGDLMDWVLRMANGEELHPLQRKFLEHAALQCGICTPGILVAAKALLDRNPDPSEEEVRFGLAGNLCRCTGYDKIVRAVLDTAQDMRRS